jgi:alcohol dehydrogenase
MRPLPTSPSSPVRAPTLVDRYSTPTLLNLIRTGQLDVGRFVTHRFALHDFEEAYDTFSRANDTGALKVVVSRS